MKLTRFYVSGANLDAKEPRFIVACEKHRDAASLRLGVLFPNRVSSWESPAALAGDECAFSDRGDCGDEE